MDSVDAGAAKERQSKQALKPEQPFRRCKQKMKKIIIRNYSLQVKEIIIYL
jgi:hypothetical protein